MRDRPIRVRNLSHSFGDVEVLGGVDFEVAPGEVVAVVGPSGCGKTTLLKIISGFYEGAGGEVERHGSTRMIYQQDGLLPWLTAEENIALGLRNVADPAERARQTAALLRLINLGGFAGHYPHQLSGGMRQRVELARALAGDTGILLMDEPFSSLDYQTRARMRGELVGILALRPLTVVLVTHDIEEAVQLADRILVLSGRPARVVCEIGLEVERPRDVTHPLLRDALKRVLVQLGLGHDAAPRAAGLRG